MIKKIVAKIIMTVARINTSNCTVLSAMLPIFFEFLIFCDLFHEPLRESSNRKI